MNPITIRTRSGVFEGELDGSDVSNEIWLSLPFSADTNMLGSEIYFEMPVDSDVKGVQTTKMKKGDIAYWPKVGAFCLFFGPTPLSGDDREPVAPYPVVKIGELKGDYSKLEDAGDRTRIVIERR